MDDDRLDPRFAAELRDRLLNEVRASALNPVPARRAEPARRPRWQPVIGLGIATVTVAAIVAGFAVVAQDHNVSTPAAQPFDGDCAAALATKRASDLVGKPLQLQPRLSPLDSSEVLAVTVVGGLDCTWTGNAAGNVADEAGISLTVLPAALRPKHVTSETRCVGSNDGADLQYICPIDVVAGGRWTTGAITGLTKSASGTKERTQQATADLESTIKALPAAAASAPLDTTGWWKPMSCEALGRRANLPEALGHANLNVGAGNGSMRSAGTSAAVDRSVALNCLATADEDTDAPFSAEIHAVAGASPALTELLEGPQIHRLDGIGDAKVYLVSDEDTGASALWVLANGGALELTPNQHSARSLLPAVAPILKTLNEHRRS
jgi:hypothetical protein